MMSVKLSLSRFHALYKALMVRWCDFSPLTLLSPQTCLALSSRTPSSELSKTFDGELQNLAASSDCDCRWVVADIRISSSCKCSSFAANGGSLLYGISLGWSAPTGPKILSSNHSFVMTKNEFSWAVSMMPLGGAASSVLSGIIRNRLWTKSTILIFALPNLLGWLSIAYATNSWMVGRILSKKTASQKKQRLTFSVKVASAQHFKIFIF